MHLIAKHAHIINTKIYRYSGNRLGLVQCYLYCLILVYVDASDACNLAAFQLGQTAIGTTMPTRSWSIKASPKSFWPKTFYFFPSEGSIFLRENNKLCTSARDQFKGTLLRWLTEKKSHTHNGSWTYNLHIRKFVLYHCASNTAENIIGHIFALSRIEIRIWRIYSRFLSCPVSTITWLLLDAPSTTMDQDLERSCLSTLSTATSLPTRFREFV